MENGLVLFAAIALAGCGKPAASVSPAEPASTNAAIPDAVTNDSFGAAAVDVITQRGAIRAGKQAKAVIEDSTAKQQKALEAVLNE